MIGLLSLGIFVSIISVICAFIWRLIQQEPKNNKADAQFSLKRIISYIYIKYFKFINGRRFNLYDLHTISDPAKAGIISQPKEWDFELPHKTKSKKQDKMLLYGTNSSGASLVTYITYKSSEVYDVFLYLNSEDGHSYILPETSISKIRDDSVKGFCSGGLKFVCLNPLRKWRISFNGLMREVNSTDKSTDDGVHVKFSFIWGTSGDIMDQASDFDSGYLSYALAKENWDGLLPKISSIQPLLDSYQQSGYFMGTVCIGNQEEKETYLWGARSRSYGFLDDTNNTLIFGYNKIGESYFTGSAALSGLLSNYCYGFTNTGSGNMDPIANCSITSWNNPSNMLSEFTIFSDNKLWNMKMEEGHKLKEISLSNPSLSLFHGTSTINGILAQNFCIISKKNPPRISEVKQNPSLIPPGKCNKAQLVVSFCEPACQLSDFTGGKGSSLGKLWSIANITNQFTVPPGVVITTLAYKCLMQNSKLKQVASSVEQVAWGNSSGDLKDVCQRKVQEFSEFSLPDSIKSAVSAKLCEVFGPDFNKLTFAVRSSASGEDSEELSAAGQMDTFLGVTGLDNICTAVMKCWSSQFDFIAVEYKRRNGQIINSPMAVVIQQMVSPDAAGVMFTCDPVTSNPGHISITSNYGLGESVVAATSEPDTITLKRNLNNDLTVADVQIGSKKSKIILKDSGGTLEEDVNDKERNQACISDEIALNLGKIGVLLEDYYGTPRDVEWAVSNNKIFLLQSRPVTSIDVDTDFEIHHNVDGPFRSEEDIFSTANVGEVMPGAMSNLSLSVMIKVMDISSQRQWARDIFVNKAMRFVPYVNRGMSLSSNHCLFSLIDGIFRNNNGRNSTAVSKSMVVSLFGRAIETDEFAARGMLRYGNDTGFLKTLRSSKIFLLLFKSKKFHKKISEKYSEHKIEFENFSKSEDLYNHISAHLMDLDEPLVSHIFCTVSSSLWNMGVLSILVSAQGDWTTEVYSDFATLIPTSSEVESADVPAAIQELAASVEKCFNPKEFKNMEAQNALSWLQTTTTPVGQKFKEFLKRHGHRCVKEFDIHSLTWGINPLPLVKILQNAVGSNSSVPRKTRQSADVDSLINSLQISLSNRQKKILRFVLPRSQEAVRLREGSKSVLIKCLDSFRQAFRHLAIMMVHEGFLPDPEIIFFLDFEELGQLLQNHSAKLLSRAVRRMKMHKYKENLRFAEIIRGVPNHSPKKNQEQNHVEESSSLVMTGTPVSKGIAQGPARVVLHIDEAVNIKPGDILITYSTDIGWSPYFPLLAGVVTELGGLISHGAVVAREYGLPCIVSLEGAAERFKSGDMVEIDGNKGILRRLETTENP